MAFTDGKPGGKSEEKKTKKAPKSTKSTFIEGGYGGADDGVVAHHIIESLQYSAEIRLDNDPDYEKVSHESSTTEEVLKYYVAKDDYEMVGSIMMQAVLEMLHEVMHEVMGGNGIQAISDDHIRGIIMGWYHSKEFRDKYARLYREEGEDAVRRSLGVNE